MAVGMSSLTADNILNAIGNNTSYAIAQCYIKLHLADPGSAGTTSPATETTRKQIDFDTAEAGTAGFRKIKNTSAITWTAIAASGTEDATHFSLWDNISAGNYLGSGTITANSYVNGDTYNIAAAAATVTLAIAT